jgi:outer membrane protein assembly factor BamB
VDGGTVYARSAGRLTSFDLGTGATRWSVAVGSADDLAGGSAAVPAVVHGSVWVPTTGQACDLVQINPANGATLSVRNNAGLPPGSVPPAAVRLAQCRTGDALPVGTRIVVPSNFSAILDSSFLPGGPFCPPGVDFLRATARVSVIDISNSGQGWVLSQDVSGCGTATAPMPFQPASLSGDLVLVAQGSVVTAYPLGACPFGQPCPAVWSVDAGGRIVGAPVVLSIGDVAVGRADGQMAVIDGATHAVEWTASVGPVLFIPLAATPTSIFAVSNDSAVTRTIVSALPAGGCGSPTCTPAWSWSSPLLSTARGRASIGGDVVYVTHGRMVSALAAAGCGAASCDPLWDGTAATTLSVSSPPVIYNGELLVGNRDGTLAAFSLPA